MSKSAYALILARSSQSFWLYEAIIDPINTLFGKSFLSSLAPSTQYFAFFYDIN